MKRNSFRWTSIKHHVTLSCSFSSSSATAHHEQPAVLLLEALDLLLDLVVLLGVAIQPQGLREKHQELQESLRCSNCSAIKAVNTFKSDEKPEKPRNP